MNLDEFFGQINFTNHGVKYRKYFIPKFIPKLLRLYLKMSKRSLHQGIVSISHIFRHVSFRQLVKVFGHYDFRHNKLLK